MCLDSKIEASKLRGAKKSAKFICS